MKSWPIAIQHTSELEEVTPAGHDVIPSPVQPFQMSQRALQYINTSRHKNRNACNDKKTPTHTVLSCLLYNPVQRSKRK